ncbi:MAG TPA: hypothetical protein VFR14_10110 [Candidatus Limnocylindrales bacterium]|nr:hypothetical protein [Candidatus Limnocylindrales bacterium]
MAAVRSMFAALLIAMTVATGVAGCALSCPAALLEGVLTRHGDELVVAQNDGSFDRVDWAHSHHRVVERDGTLVVVDWLGVVQAREGDFVRLGGGEAQTGVWGICGLFEVASPPP